MPTRKIIVVPCMVKSRLKTCGETKVLPAAASCQRITPASRPAIRKNARPATTYMTPRRLWSTVTTHSWSFVSTPARSTSMSGASIRGATMLMVVVPSSAKRPEIGHQLIQLALRKLHRRHERTGLQRGGIVHPRAQILRRVGHHSRPEGRAAHHVREVGAEHAVGGCA